jgi:hypothetical protein
MVLSSCTLPQPVSLARLACPHSLCTSLSVWLSVCCLPFSPAGGCQKKTAPEDAVLQPPAPVAPHRRHHALQFIQQHHRSHNHHPGARALGAVAALSSDASLLGGTPACVAQRTQRWVAAAALGVVVVVVAGFGAAAAGGDADPGRRLCVRDHQGGAGKAATRACAGACVVRKQQRGARGPGGERWE